jgi:tetratricopeptide (TPR) repeat protein
MANLDDPKNLEQNIQQLLSIEPTSPLLSSLYHDLGVLYYDRLNQRISTDRPADQAAGILALQTAIAGRKNLDDPLLLATSLIYLTNLYEVMGQHEQSLHPYQQAFEIHLSTFGDRHPDTALSLNNLASIHQSMGNDDDAEPLFKQAIEIYEHTGTDHPIVFTILQKLVRLYISKGEHPRAGALLNRWLEICQTQLPSDHFQTQQIQTALANLKQDGLYKPKALPQKSANPKAFGAKPKKGKK